MNMLKCYVIMLPCRREVSGPTEMGRYINMLSKYTSARGKPILSYDKYMDGVNVPSPQHLCLVSDRDIQAGSWVYNVRSQIVDQTAITWQHGYDKEAFKRVEAATDIIPRSMRIVPLGVIPSTFVEDYVRMQGEIREVLLEMQFPLTDTVNGPVLREDGTVIIHRTDNEKQVPDRAYTRLHEDAKKLWEQQMRGINGMQKVENDISTTTGTEQRFLVIEDFNGTIALVTDEEGNPRELGSLHEAQELARECQGGVVVPLDLLKEVFHNKAKRIRLQTTTLVPGALMEQHDYLFIN